MVVTGAIVPGLLAALAPLVWRAGRLADAGGATLHPLVDALAALRLLRYAPAPVLESLALSGRRLPVVHGQVVIRQGEASDDVYVVLSGSFVVLQAQEGLPPKVINRCTTGDSFGVIGPLAGVPRTASVMADGPGRSCASRDGIIRLRVQRQRPRRRRLGRGRPRWSRPRRGAAVAAARVPGPRPPAPANVRADR